MKRKQKPVVRKATVDDAAAIAEFLQRDDLIFEIGDRETLLRLIFGEKDERSA